MTDKDRFDVAAERLACGEDKPRFEVTLGKPAKTKPRNPQADARMAALVATATTVAAIAGVTSFVTTHAATLNGTVIVPGFLDVKFLHNRGISFSLFSQGTQTGVRMLVLVAILVIAVLAVLAYRNSRTVIGVGLGMVIGGALINNVIDRAIHAAVFDYLAFHLGALPLFVCNAPDIAISFGVLIWLAGEVFARKEPQA